MLPLLPLRVRVTGWLKRKTLDQLTSFGYVVHIWPLLICTSLAGFNCPMTRQRGGGLFALNTQKQEASVPLQKNGGYGLLQ